MFDELSLRNKIKRLSETVWEGRANGTAVEEWLANFDRARADGVNEQLQMLFLLSNFLYFGTREIRELLRAQFKDLYEKPTLHEIRRANADTTNIAFIEQEFQERLKKTRFLGVGNPAESGPHLLYYFRQENELPRHLFMNHFELPGFQGANPRHGPPLVTRYIFIDDLCASGQQIVEFATQVLGPLKKAFPAAKTSYFPLFATSEGLATVRGSRLFDSVETMMELDETFKCFAPTSRIYPAAPPLDRTTAASIASAYGSVLCPKHPLGYRDCQLALGFSHNTPDNSLPVFWGEADVHIPSWRPIFRRYQKI